MSMFQRILVVCVGNICRSPMAEAVLAKALGPSVSVSSAGISALIGHPADPTAISLLANKGIDISSHRARQISPALVHDAQLIMVMEEWQQKQIESNFIAARGRVHRLGRWGRFDIPDPYRKPPSEFENVLALIEQGVSDWKEKLA